MFETKKNKVLFVTGEYYRIASHGTSDHFADMLGKEWKEIAFEAATVLIRGKEFSKEFRRKNLAFYGAENSAGRAQHVAVSCGVVHFSF